MAEMVRLIRKVDHVEDLGNKVPYIYDSVHDKYFEGEVKEGMAIVEVPAFSPYSSYMIRLKEKGTEHVRNEAAVKQEPKVTVEEETAEKTEEPVNKKTPEYAKKLLKEGLSVPEVMEATGYAESSVEKFAKELRAKE